METMRKPDWIKSRIPSGTVTAFVNSELRTNRLNTVCEEAKCPNRADCWNAGTATFMVMGSVCTRHCNFCSVESAGKGEALDENEPANVARAVEEMKLKYAVLTSVDRDDLPDLGAGHFADCIKEVKRANGNVKVEALIPDFQGKRDYIEKIVNAKPDVIGHNIEVVERLQKIARDGRAGYKQSLSVLHNLKLLNQKIFTKSSIMLGLGETRKEVLQAMNDLRKVGCDFLTIGQYLQPSKKNLPVFEFVEPEIFAELEKIGLEKGFKAVASGSLVRSSYRARELFGFEGE